MNEQEAKDYVIKALGRHQSPNIILETLCTEAGMNWEQAKSFVRQVIAENGDQIVIKQSPLFLILGTGFILGGLGLIIYELLPVLLPVFFNPTNDPTPLNSRDIRKIVIGIFMVLAGLRTMWNTIVRLWNS